MSAQELCECNKDQLAAWSETRQMRKYGRWRDRWSEEDERKYYYTRLYAIAHQREIDNAE